VAAIPPETPVKFFPLKTDIVVLFIWISMINFTSNHSFANACGLGNFLEFETSICSLFSKLLLDYHEVANSSNFSVNSFNLRIDLVRSLRHNGYCFIHITSGSSITVLLYILLEHSSFKSITLIIRFCLYQLSAYHRPATFVSAFAFIKPVCCFGNIQSFFHFCRNI
jgi:hypothetical protein